MVPRSAVGIACILPAAIMAAVLLKIPNAHSEPESRLRDLERRIYQKVNEIRRERQAPVLSWNEDLASEARRHANNMSARSFFAHQDPKRGDIDQRLNLAAIEWNRCAENIYREKGFDDPVGDAVQSWLESPEHRRNMLDSGLAETGVGAFMQRDGTMYIVQIFIKNSFTIKTQLPDGKK
jgi:uncharacterized protein YkwD